MADMKKLRLYDTASRKVSEFKPIVAGQASIYLCGATVKHLLMLAMLEVELTLIFCAVG